MKISPPRCPKLIHFVKVHYFRIVYRWGCITWMTKTLVISLTIKGIILWVIFIHSFVEDTSFIPIHMAFSFSRIQLWTSIIDINNIRVMCTVLNCVAYLPQKLQRWICTWKKINGLSFVEHNISLIRQTDGQSMAWRRPQGTYHRASSPVVGQNIR